MNLKPIIEQIDAAAKTLKKLDKEVPPVKDRDAYHLWCTKIHTTKKQLENSIANIIGYGL